MKNRKLRPCDCGDNATASLLNEQGIGTTNGTIMIKPNIVEITLSDTTIRIPMSRFKRYAEWYLEPQDI